jgi:hypothetical protein
MISQLSLFLSDKTGVFGLIALTVTVIVKTTGSILSKTYPQALYSFRSALCHLSTKSIKTAAPPLLYPC